MGRDLLPGLVPVGDIDAGTVRAVDPGGVLRDAGAVDTGVDALVRDCLHRLDLGDVGVVPEFYPPVVGGDPLRTVRVAVLNTAVIGYDGLVRERLRLPQWGSHVIEVQGQRVTLRLFCDELADGLRVAAYSLREAAGTEPVAIPLGQVDNELG